MDPPATHEHYLKEGALSPPLLDMIRRAEKENRIYFFDSRSHYGAARPVDSVSTMPSGDTVKEEDEKDELTSS